MIKPGVNHDGQWKSEDLVEQAIQLSSFKLYQKTIQLTDSNKTILFEKYFLDTVCVFEFDNATSHSCFANDALIATQMNLKLGGSNKYTFRDGVLPNGEPQKIHLENGKQKEIKRT